MFIFASRSNLCVAIPIPSLRGPFLLFPLPVVARSLILNSPRSNLRVTYIVVARSLILNSPRSNLRATYIVVARSLVLNSPRSNLRVTYIVFARSLLAIPPKQSPCHYSPSPSLRGPFLLFHRSNLRVTYIVVARSLLAIPPPRLCEVPHFKLPPKQSPCHYHPIPSLRGSFLLFSRSNLRATTISVFSVVKYMKFTDNSMKIHRKYTKKTKHKTSNNKIPK